MNSKQYKYLYGPVPSRRLGLSLGVDMVPMKTCTYNCIYCQLGAGETVEPRRKEFISPSSFLDEISSWLEAGGTADFITLTGSGEPTLNTAIGGVIQGIRELTDIRTAVITNGSLLSDPQVRADISGADLVMPSLDAGSEDVFRKMNRSGHIDFTSMVEGLVAFSNEYSGALWLEVFLVPGVNTDEQELGNIKSIITRMNLAKVFLNTSVRPPAEESAVKAGAGHIELALNILGSDTYSIDTFQSHASPHETGAAVSKETILDMLKRRPCSAEDVAAGLKIPLDTAEPLLQDLVRIGVAVSEQREGILFYRGRT